MEFELEIKEDDPEHVRHVLRYHVEGYDESAVGIVVSRTNEFTPEERLADIAFIDEVAEEEINGVKWAVGKNTEKNDVIIYACPAGESTMQEDSWMR